MPERIGFRKTFKIGQREFTLKLGSASVSEDLDNLLDDASVCPSLPSSEQSSDRDVGLKVRSRARGSSEGLRCSSS